MTVNEVSGAVIDAAMKVHSAVGPGLLESAYEACLVHELRKRGHRIETQLVLPVDYDGVTIDAGYRIDLLVDNAVVVELKAVSRLEPIHEAQLLTYLRLSGKSVGLLINFNVVRLKDGIRRMVNNLPEDSPQRAQRSAGSENRRSRRPDGSPERQRQERQP